MSATPYVPVVANSDGSVTLNVPNNADYTFGPATLALGGVTIDLTGATAQLQVRRFPQDGTPLLDFGVTATTTLTLGGPAGTITATASRALMEAMFIGSFVWDLVITRSGVATRWLGGPFVVYAGVSR